MTAGTWSPTVSARIESVPTDQLRVLRKPEVVRMIGLSASRVRQLIEAGQFPEPIQLGANSVGWLDHEVRGWLVSRLAHGSKAAPLGARAANAAHPAGKAAARPVGAARPLRGASGGRASKPAAAQRRRGA